MRPVQGNVQWEAESERTVQVRDVNIPPEGMGLEEKRDCTCPCKVPPAPWRSPHGDPGLMGGGLTLARCQVPTKAALSLPLLNWTWGEKIKRKARGSR